MPQSDNQVEAQTETTALQAEPVSGPSAKEMAEAEERRAAEMIRQSQASQEEPQREEMNLVMEAAKGRENLLQKMREHAAQTAAKKAEHKPPPMTDRQRALIEEEQAAGIRARQRHEAEQASRPPPPAKEKWDGSNTPVHRPGDIVPDPALPAGAFAAGTRQYSADA